jgi:hypothetical protein
MTIDTKLAIRRGLQLRAGIEAAKAELKAIEEAVVCVARHVEHIDLVDSEREGKQALLEGEDVFLPVIFESDMIAGTIQQGSNLHLALQMKYNEENVAKFYRPKNILEMLPKDGKAFRQLARAALPPETAAQFVHDCLSRDKHGIPKSRIVVAWDNVKQKAALPCLAFPMLATGGTASMPGWSIPETLGIPLVCLLLLGIGFALGFVFALWIGLLGGDRIPDEHWTLPGQAFGELSRAGNDETPL